MLIQKENWFKRKIRRWAWKLFYKLENMDSGGSDFYRNGEAKFINSMFEFYAKKSSNQVLCILDIGANLGQYSRTLTTLAEQRNIPIEIHLFEPLSECFKQIHLELGEKTNLCLNNFGISEEEMTTNIFYDNETSGLASLYPRKIDQYNIYMNKSEEIKLKRMDQYIQEKSIEHIHFAKIDVEGHELSVLRSFGDYLNSSFIDFIQFEYGETYFDAHIRLLEVYQLLEGCGFKIAKITRNGLIQKKYYQYMENFIYANYVAITDQVLDLNQ